MRRSVVCVHFAFVAWRAILGTFYEYNVLIRTIHVTGLYSSIALTAV